MAKPQVVSVEPINYATGVDVSSSIKVTFNTDLDAQSLSGNIKLHTSWGEVVEGRIVYRKKVITFTPVEPLEKGTNYVLTIQGDNNLEDGSEDGIRNILEETMAGSFTSRFMTDATGLMPAPYVLSPTNNTIIKELPTYTWESVEGASSYEVEISKTNTFSTKVFPLEETQIHETTLSPNIEYEDGIYYWRVRAVSGVNDKGAWSSIMQFNLSRESLGQITIEDGAFIDTTDDVTFTGTMELELIETFPKDLATLVPTNVANLYFRMIGDIDLSAIDMDSVQLSGKHISGDFEEESHGRVNGKITIVTSDDYTTYIIFTPEPIPIVSEEIPDGEETSVIPEGETNTGEGEVTT